MAIALQQGNVGAVGATVWVGLTLVQEAKLQLLRECFPSLVQILLRQTLNVYW
ncbi:MAG: hypothetical protein ACYT04_48230 [Nostoc sp.]